MLPVWADSHTRVKPPEWQGSASVSTGTGGAHRRAPAARRSQNTDRVSRPRAQVEQREAGRSGTVVGMTSASLRSSRGGAQSLDSSGALPRAPTASGSRTGVQPPDSAVGRSRGCQGSTGVLLRVGSAVKVPRQRTQWERSSPRGNQAGAGGGAGRTGGDLRVSPLLHQAPVILPAVHLSTPQRPLTRRLNARWQRFPLLVPAARARRKSSGTVTCPWTAIYLGTTRRATRAPPRLKKVDVARV